MERPLGAIRSHLLYISRWPCALDNNTEIIFLIPTEVEVSYMIKITNAPERKLIIDINPVHTGIIRGFIDSIWGVKQGFNP